MLFASTSLAARIERAECRMLIEAAEAVARRRPGRGVLVRPLAGGVATYTGPGSPLNKVAGLGFAGGVDPAELEDLEAAFGSRGTSVQVELSCLADPSIGALLTGRGYVLRNFENVLGRALPLEATVSPARPDLQIAVSPPEELQLWMDVAVTGFATPDTQGVPSHEEHERAALEEIFGDMASADGFARYLARRQGVPAGAASMRQSEGVAQLAGAATLPEHRRRGVQSALLAARLELAGREGCDVAVVTTQPGSRSQENVQRHGFELLYTRAVLVRER
jgi:GNAT superfamily N-acetyltransferase